MYSALFIASGLFAARILRGRKCVESPKIPGSCLLILRLPWHAHTYTHFDRFPLFLHDPPLISPFPQQDSITKKEAKNCLAFPTLSLRITYLKKMSIYYGTSSNPIQLLYRASINFCEVLWGW